MLHPYYIADIQFLQALYEVKNNNVLVPLLAKYRMRNDFFVSSINQVNGFGVLEHFNKCSVHACGHIDVKTVRHHNVVFTEFAFLVEIETEKAIFLIKFKFRWLFVVFPMCCVFLEYVRVVRVVEFCK